MDNRINILMAADDKFFKPFLVTLYSIRKNTKANIRLFFAGQLDSQQKNKIHDIDKDIDLRIIDVNAPEFEAIRNAKTTEAYPINALYRIVCPFVINDVDRVMWVDSDIIFDKDISTLYHSNLKGYSIGAMLDQIRLKEKFVSVGQHTITNYFISCVIIFDITKVKSNYTLDQFNIIGKDIKDITFFPDQDIMNIVYHGDVCFIGDEYTQRFVWNQLGDSKIKERNYLFYHFAGDVKPWTQSFYNFNNEDIFWEYGRHIYLNKERLMLYVQKRIFFIRKALHMLIKKILNQK